MLILRHAWLNLWDKHMTTGRINQVSTNQFRKLAFSELFLQTNFHSIWGAPKLASKHREFYFHHTFQAATTTAYPSEKHIAVNRGNPTQQQADFHSLRNDAKLGIHQKYKYKLSNTLQLRRAARLRRLYPSTRARRYKRVDDGDAKLKHFFNRKTYAQTHAFAHIFSCFTNYAKNLVRTRVMNSQSREPRWEMSRNREICAKIEVWGGVPVARASFIIPLILFAGF